MAWGMVGWERATWRSSRIFFDPFTSVLGERTDPQQNDAGLQVAKIGLLVLADWGLTHMPDQQRRDILDCPV